MERRASYAKSGAEKRAAVGMGAIHRQGRVEGGLHENGKVESRDAVEQKES